jgi:hypothetical protein
MLGGVKLTERLAGYVRIWLWPLSAFAAFILLVEAILFYPFRQPLEFDPMGAAELIALLSGAITAAGLTGIYRQFQQGSREAALRLDELHAAFNAADMQVHRDLGWKYLQSLMVRKRDGTWDDRRLQAFATWWVCSTGKPPTAPGTPGPEESRRAYDDRHTWAVTAIINFYVRLENHFELHADRSYISDRQFLQATGPFVWRYWEADIMAFVKVCKAKTFTDHKQRNVPPYFVEPLARLERRYDKAIESSQR